MNEKNMEGKGKQHMKNKILIIVPIIIVVAIIFILIPKHNNDIKETMVETNLPEPTPEITPSPKPTAEPTPTPTPTSTPEPTPTPTEEVPDEELDSANGIEVNSTSDDVILGEDEYKGDDEGTTPTISDEVMDDLANQILQEILQEHPELTNSAGTTNKSPDYISVDGPVDNGVIPEYTVGESGKSDVPAGTVY